MAPRRRSLAAAAFLWLASSLPAARAHEMQPAFLELREAPAGHVDVTWKVPLYQGRPLPIAPAFPDGWEEASPPRGKALGNAILEQWRMVPGPNGLEGATVAIDGPLVRRTDVLVRAHAADGRSATRIIRPENPQATIGFGEGSAPTWAYLAKGVDHILLGADHLLFVLGLLLIVKDRWALVKTITSFTVAHSITLGLATLGLAAVPLDPLNVCIALSILFLGPEIVRTWRGETSLTIRYPWVVAFAFGLLHGFGFASGLSAADLPAGELAMALLLFNVGVEIGQVGFVLLVLALIWSFAKLEIRWPRWVARLPGLSIGTLGGYWTVQRLAIMFAL